MMLKVLGAQVETHVIKKLEVDERSPVVSAKGQTHEGPTEAARGKVCAQERARLVEMVQEHLENEL